MKTNVMQPGMYAYVTARTAHFDEVFSLAVAAGLSAIQGWTAAGSLLVVDYLLKDVLAGATSRYGATGLLSKAAAHDEPLICGYSAAAIEAKVKDLGYRAQSHLQATESTARCLKKLDTDLTGPFSYCFPNLVLVVEK